MLKLKETVIVEGKYDQIRLANLLDAHILPTDGFGILPIKRNEPLPRLAEKNGIILVTDSDRAGFRIRHLYHWVCEFQIYQTSLYTGYLGKGKQKNGTFQRRKAWSGGDRRSGAVGMFSQGWD